MFHSDLVSFESFKSMFTFSFFMLLRVRTEISCSLDGGPALFPSVAFACYILRMWQIILCRCARQVAAIMGLRERAVREGCGFA